MTIPFSTHNTTLNFSKMISTQNPSNDMASTWVPVKEKKLRVSKPLVTKSELSIGSNGLSSEKKNSMTSVPCTAVICRMCHNPGHKIPDCPLRRDSVL